MGFAPVLQRRAVRTSTPMSLARLAGVLPEPLERVAEVLGSHGCLPPIVWSVTDAPSADIRAIAGGCVSGYGATAETTDAARNRGHRVNVAILVASPATMDKFMRYAETCARPLRASRSARGAAIAGCWEPA